jgi:hypothetical protein
MSLFANAIYLSEHTCAMYPSLRPLVTQKPRDYLQMQLIGGLGNHMFQLAALDHICRLTSRDPQVCIMNTHRPGQRHLDNFLNRWLCFETVHAEKAIQLIEEQLSYQAWKPRLDTHRYNDVSIVSSYLQDYRYIDGDFLTYMHWTPTIVSESRVFIHVRGGDYINNPTHDVGLDDYYLRAIRHFPHDTPFIIFTNDYPYAKSRPWVQTLRDVTYADNSRQDFEELTHMSMCSGGICANSSFSFWAAFRLKAIATHTPTIIMPNKWFNDSKISTAGFYFPGVTRVSV